MPKAAKKRSRASQKKASTQRDPPVRPFTRDPDYYFHDGSCVFLVQNRLFKIQRSLLEQNSTVFQAMFALPQPTSDPTSPLMAEGLSDDNPVVCHDTVDEFRALCWALYAPYVSSGSPMLLMATVLRFTLSSITEIAKQRVCETTNGRRLVLILGMAYKYDMASLQEWVFDAINGLAEAGKLLQLPPKFSLTNECLRRLLDLLDKYNQETLTLRVHSLILARIPCSDNSEVSDHSKILKCSKTALSIVEGHGRRAFQAQVYYKCLQAIGKFETHPTGNLPPTSINAVIPFVAEEPISKLGEIHRLRLYQGFWSLTRLRQRLDNPPSLENESECTQHWTCERGWKSWWGGVLVAVQKGGRNHIADPGEFLLELQEVALKKPIHMMYIDGYTDTGEVPCHARIRSQICAMKKQFDDSLADYFMIPAE